MSNTEQQLCAEIADLRAQLDAVGAGGVGKLMPPAAPWLERPLRSEGYAMTDTTIRGPLIEDEIESLGQRNTAADYAKWKFVDFRIAVGDVIRRGGT